jgi:hypothetical protein
VYKIADRFINSPRGTPSAAPTDVDARLGQKASQNSVVDEAAAASKNALLDMSIKIRLMIV